MDGTVIVAFGAEENSMSYPADSPDVVVPETTSTALRDRVRWGPIVAGIFAALATLLILTTIGVSIGLAVFEPNELGQSNFGTASAVWGIASALIAFGVGGWLAAYSSGATGIRNGVLNGTMVGVATIVLMLWLVGAGLGNLLGAVAGNLDDITAISADVTGEVTGDDATAAYDRARDNSWIAVVGLLGALAATAVGGLIGSRERETTVVHTSTPRSRPETRSSTSSRMEEPTRSSSPSRMEEPPRSTSPSRMEEPPRASPPSRP